MAAHRFWRIYCRTNDYNGTMSLVEVAMAAAPGGPNLIGGGTALADSVYDPGSGSYAPVKAIDGDPGTFWNSDAGPPDWWGYDFTISGACEVVEVKLTARNDYFSRQAPRDWDLQSSDNGTAWATEHSFASATWTPGGQQSFSYAALTLTPIGTGQVAGAIAAVAAYHAAPTAAAAEAGVAVIGSHAAPAVAAAKAGVAVAGHHLAPTAAAASVDIAVLGFHAASKAQVDGVWLSVMLLQRQGAPHPPASAPQILIMV